MDTAVSFVLNNLPQLIQVAKSEANLPSEVENKIELLQNELEMMNAFLKASQGKRKEHDLVRVVVSQIIDVTHQAEDVIDTYIVNLVRHNREALSGIIVGPFDHQLMLHDVDAAIQNIKTSINEIYENKDKYGIEEGVSNEEDSKAAAEAGSLLRRREVEEDEVIGFDKYSEEFIKLLKQGDSGSPRKVVSITGMGGMGKTTFARKIYKDYQVEKHFDIIAWVYVSNDYRPTHLLLTLLRSFKSITESESMSLPEVKRMVHGCLIDMRYLIVLDDIWNTQVWDEIQDCFPNENNGSRILITSRIKDVASYASRTPPYNNQTTPPIELQFLEEADSWKLFCRKVFHEETCPDPLLQPHGRKIVQSCKGLPLSIVVSAGLLADKTLPGEWSEIADNIHWFINQGKKSHVEDILKLSYNSLPQELKPCFLYFGIYPEDSEIPVRQLIQLWIAEGFIQLKQTGAKVPEPEVVAEKYLRDLIDRSLIQVASKRSDGGAKTCRIHDLLRDFCISESREYKFFEICRDVDTINKSKPRRLSLHCGTETYRSSNPCDHSSTRSLFCFRHEGFSFYGSKNLEWFLNEFKLVRVLDLGQRNSYFFDDKLDKFIYLRYLRVETLQSETTVSDSICNLRNLETLDTRGWRVKTLPTAIWKLKRLRHVYLEGSVILPDLAKGADNKILWNLQTLSTIDLHRKNVFLLEKGRFPKLRKLGFNRSFSDPKASELLQRLKCLTHLSTLKIITPPELPKSADGFPPNITKITLKDVDSSYVKTYMNTLANLPYLRILKLLKGKQGYLSSSERDLYFAPGGFQQLQVFEMEELKHEKLTLEKDAIPQLQRLIIKSCKGLIGLPDELWSSKALAEVQILWPSMKMAHMLQNLEKKDGIKLIVYPPLDEESDPFDD